MFVQLADDNFKSLNISYNSGNEAIECLSTYMHRSTKLVHFDISGMGIKLEGLLNLARDGIRKSRTL
jgi:hypothetical protein